MLYIYSIEITIKTSNIMKNSTQTTKTNDKRNLVIFFTIVIAIIVVMDLCGAKFK